MFDKKIYFIVISSLHIIFNFAMAIKRLFSTRQTEKQTYIALQGTTNEPLPQVKLGKTLNLQLFGVCF